MGLFTDGFKLLKKASEPLYKSPKSIQETIEIMAIAENGIFEVSKNHYSKSYRFQDINYTTATENEQIDIFERYCKFLNSLDCNYKITINNKNKDMSELRNIFNHQTNVDVDNRFTVYGIRDLGTELSPITMLVMMESIQNRIVENGKRGKATWLYIDEFHVLLNSEYSAKYLQQLWKKVRKQGGLCTGITQNVVDLLQNYTATTMLANSEFVALLKQANTDSAKMADVIGVSEAQLRFVTNTGSGMGLIKCGSVVVPFDNTISKDTGLYKLYNTNIHERIEMAEKEKATKLQKD